MRAMRSAHPGRIEANNELHRRPETTWNDGIFHPRLIPICGLSCATTSFVKLLKPHLYTTHLRSPFTLSRAVKGVPDCSVALPVCMYKPVACRTELGWPGRSELAPRFGRTDARSPALRERPVLPSPALISRQVIGFRTSSLGLSPHLLHTCPACLH